MPQWMAQFLNELGIISKPVPSTDSEGTYNLSKSSRFARRGPHMENRFHYPRQKVRAEKLEARMIAGKENPADLFTKLLPVGVLSTWNCLWMSTQKTT